MAKKGFTDPQGNKVNYGTYKAKFASPAEKKRFAKEEGNYKTAKAEGTIGSPGK